MAPNVSVVIPTRNRRTFLARALGTVLEQQGVELEVFVVDDASQDDTAEFVRALGDPRVTFIHHDAPRGVAAARNAALARARAPWIAFLDDDDFWAPHKLALQLQAAEGTSWVCVGAVVVDTELAILSCTKPPPEPDWGHLLAYNCVPGGGSGTMVRTDVARELEGFDTKLSILADWDMWIRFFLRSMPSTVCRPLVGYVRHDGSMSHVSKSLSDELGHIVAKHEDARRAWGVEVERERWLKWFAAMQLRSGNRREAVETYLHLIHRYRDAKSIARAALGGLFPRLLVRYWRWHLRRMVPPDWHDEAEGWLAPIRSKSLRPPIGTSAAA